MNQDKRLYLLDAYALIYRAYYAFIRTPRINSKGMNTSAIFGFVNTLEDLLKRENPTHIAVAFDPKGGTFRHELYDAYKAQREETPEGIKIAVPYIKEILDAYNIPILEVANFEADDVIGSMSKLAKARGYDVYMMTPDKDYAQLVEDHIYIYRPKTSGKEIETLDVEAVKAKFGVDHPLQVIDLLGLMGDVSDNIPGCKGVGEKTAQKLIAEFGSIDNLLANTNLLKGAIKTKIESNIEEIKLSKFLATIKTDIPLTFDDEKLTLGNFNEEKLSKVFEELEFRNIKSTVLNNVSKKPVLVNPQGSLFDVFEANDTVAPKETNLEALETTKIAYKLLDSEDLISDFARSLEKSKKFCFDTETTNIDPILAELVGISISTEENKAVYIPVPADKEKAAKRIAPLLAAFENEAIEKVGQNMKYDIIVLSKYGVQVKGTLFDTMIAHYLLQPEQRHNMDYLAEVYLNYKTIHIDELIGPKGKNQKSMRDLSPEQVKDYACEDADITLRLESIFRKELLAQGLSDLFFDIEMPLMIVLADMEMAGVRVDTDALKISSEKLTQYLCDIEKEVFEMAGMEFNISSAKQVGEVLFGTMKIDEKAKKTKTGQYSTSEEVLEKLRAKHPIIGKILEYRGIKKLLSTYINALPELINPETGKIHTSFNQTVTATGRLSSSNPNLQNIPIRDEEGKEIRRAFVPDNGCLFFSADYSQIELRIMAHLSQDSNMMDAFLHNEDIHTATSAKIYKVSNEEVTKDMRRKAKTANFGIIYGISVFGLAERLTIARGEAKELIDGYFATYPKVKEYMDNVIAEAKLKGYVETILNRKRVLADINSGNSIVRGYAERNAINAPIQGSAADIIKIAMIRIYKRFETEKLKSKMILQVHDELNFNVFPDEKERVAQIVIEEMQNAYPLTVPLIADSSFGENWLEAH
ncbi:MAG: DNA polymerase I [Bacteroidales bacterium]